MVASTLPVMTELGTDWRMVDGVATTWFDAPSLIEGAALAGRPWRVADPEGNEIVIVSGA